ncbi:MAG: response regulator, partial [Lachnospiraceae bacterium]|nr:response regulator [Lachnospiraceae bacterium]
ALSDALVAAEHANRAKTTFLNNMSHDIRTPMNAIVGLSELALKEDLSDKGREAVEQISSSANALLVIINDILDFSRLEEGTMEITPSEYDVNQMMNEAVRLTSMGLSDKPVEMRLTIDDNIPPRLLGDSARIRQVLNNVISNAVKFTKEGSIDIRVRHEKADAGKINLLIDVADTGIGIKEEDIDRIFESFSQIDSKRNREVEGTGLGLAITQRLIRLMGGSIEVESKYGKGSIFKICIPQEVAAQQTGEEAVPAAAVTEKKLHASKAKILVVDDNSVNLYVARSLLGVFGISATCVLSGALALKAVSKNHYDMILMDYMMPQMDGIEAMKKIREDHPEYRDIPIIAFTANAVEEARELLLKEGMDDFIAKPVKGADLEALLLKWLPEDVRD